MSGDNPDKNDELYFFMVFSYTVTIWGRYGFDCGGRNLCCMSRSSGLVKKSNIFYLPIMRHFQ